MQSGNVFLLLALLAILCTFFVSERAAKLYLLCVALGDLGHISCVYAGLGPKVFWDVANWNDMVWGHVGVSSFYFFNRIATAAGVFDKASQQLQKGKKRA